MVEAGADEVPEETLLEAFELAHQEIVKICEAQEELRRQVGKPEVARPRAHRGARARARPGHRRGDCGARAARGRGNARGDQARSAPELDMSSSEDDIVREMQVRSSLDVLLERGRLEAVTGPVRAQFEDDLRALTEAEQDSKQLKSAKRHLLFDRIVETVELPFPVGPATVEGDAPLVKDGLTRQFVKKAAETVYKDLVRKKIAVEKRRPDGRSNEEIRPIECEVSVTPRTHGSALFTRGQTQIMSLLTLGTAKEGQRIDDLSLEQERRYMHHYNFPPYSVGETGFMRGPKRRDIGHGALAQRALEPMIPPADEFPYTIRIVSETLESNGSSSMGSVCGSTLALMDAGVPIKAPVGGIAMGLVKEGDDYAILTDIQGAEDHLGDMDFKVAGIARRDHRAPDGHQDHRCHPGDHAGRSRAGEARPRVHPRPDGRGHLRSPREELAAHAPRITTIKIDPEQIGLVIGKGGETIRALEADHEVQIDIEEDGTILIYATEGTQADAAICGHPGADEGARGGGRLHGQGREDDRLRRLRRAEEGHRRPPARLERRPGPRGAHRGRHLPRRHARRRSSRRSTRCAAASGSSSSPSTRTACSSSPRS